MKPGPPKKPTELKVLQGLPGGAHKLTPNEPKPGKLKSFEPPAILNLTPEAEQVWRQIAPDLAELGILTQIDRVALGRYCEILPEWLKAKQVLKEKGPHYPIWAESAEEVKALVKAGKQPTLKYIAQRPETGQFNKLSRELLRYENEFGMTPAARAGLSVTPRDEEQDEVRKRLYRKE